VNVFGRDDHVRLFDGFLDLHRIYSMTADVAHVVHIPIEVSYAIGPQLKYIL